MMDVFLVIAVFSVVQSLFGVGLLVFGTPTLLLLGYSLEECLVFLLPSSVTISLLQLATLRSTRSALASEFHVWCLPVLLGCLLLRLTSGIAAQLEVLMAAVLLAGAVTTISPRLRAEVGRLLLRNRPLYLSAMGAVHGVSNMGGSMLTVYAHAVASDKEAILKTTAFGNLFFALVQLATIAALRGDLFAPEMAVLPAASAAIYWTLGRSIFAATSQGGYRALLGSIMTAYGALLMWRGFSVL
ncbi:MAG TPA: hypothetical protein VK943_05520 [Arenibaculum sp.]|nr:hypothetical protein [Arenibaculum sp.]